MAATGNDGCAERNETTSACTAVRPGYFLQSGVLPGQVSVARRCPPGWFANETHDAGACPHQCPLGWGSRSGLDCHERVTLGWCSQSEHCGYKYGRACYKYGESIEDHEGAFRPNSNYPPNSECAFAPQEYYTKPTQFGGKAPVNC